MAESGILATVRASAARRGLGVGALGALGLLLIWLALTEPPQSPLWQGFLVVLGVGALWVAQLMWRATSRTLVLTGEALCDDAGRELAQVADIVKVDRSTFAMKPSNGFVLTLREPAARAWQPGLWWRLGRRVAVGGVTSGAETKPMADILASMILSRDSEA